MLMDLVPAFKYESNPKLISATLQPEDWESTECPVTAFTDGRKLFPEGTPYAEVAAQRAREAGLPRRLERIVQTSSRFPNSLGSPTTRTFKFSENHGWLEVERTG